MVTARIVIKFQVFTYEKVGFEVEPKVDGEPCGEPKSYVVVSETSNLNLEVGLPSSFFELKGSI